MRRVFHVEYYGYRCQKNILRCLIKKRTPSHTISLMFDKAIHYDMYSIYIKDENGDDYLF